jgi:8-oxo-dGTP pyrophosphatase MutT (NUDIX family)
MHKIYFGDKALIISSEHKSFDDNESISFTYAESGLIDPIQALNEQQVQNCHLMHEDENEVLDAFKTHFTVLQAAGGLVKAESGELLLIFRRGKWDLPKGKLDEGEDLQQCAVREVEEETGLEAPVLGDKIGVTYHTYSEKGKSILKESHWYNMSVREKQDLKPQQEEDIEICTWVAAVNLEEYKKNMHPSVRDILEIAGY